MSRVVLAVALLAATPAFAETHYFGALPDVPLPPGFMESVAATGFDGADGRLIMAEATGAGATASIRAFYTSCLPSLGWSLSPTGDDELVFLRGRERLSLTLSGDAAHTRLHAQLTVRPASMNAD